MQRYKKIEMKVTFWCDDTGGVTGVQSVGR